MQLLDWDEVFDSARDSPELGQHKTLHHQGERHLPHPRYTRFASDSGILAIQIITINEMIHRSRDSVTRDHRPRLLTCLVVD